MAMLPWGSLQEACLTEPLPEPRARDGAALAPAAAGARDTATLIREIRAGDAGAREALFRRYLPLLRRWASGRLPVHARHMADTDDIVQATLMRSLAHVEKFEPRFHGSFLAYLRQGLVNEIRQQIRQARRVPAREALSEELVDEDLPTLLEQIVGAEQLRAYQDALARLSKAHQEVLIMRIEFGMEYAEIGSETGRSAEAARVMVARGAIELGRLLGAAR